MTGQDDVNDVVGGADRLNAAALTTAEREVRVVELRRARVSYAEIARRLGYANASGAQKAYHRAITRVRVAAVNLQREEEADVIDRLHFAYWKAALTGDQDAAKIIIKCSEARRRLYGLDAAVRVKAELTDATRERVREVVGQLRALPPAPDELAG